MSTGVGHSACDVAPSRGRAPRLRGRLSTLHWWHEVLLLGLLYLAYEVARGLVDHDLPVAMANGHSLLNWEQGLHLDPERWLNALIHHSTPVAVVFSYYYALLHYLITPAVLIWMYRSHVDYYRRARTWLIASTSLGLIGFAALPTAPPRLLGSGFRDTLADVQRWGWWSGDASAPKGMGGLTDQFAAMPSLHVGWALWCGVLLFRFGRHRIVRLLGVLYPVATAIVVMSTANHYFVDVLAGVVVMLLGAGVVWGVVAIRNRVVMRRLLRA